VGRSDATQGRQREFAGTLVFGFGLLAAAGLNFTFVGVMGRLLQPAAFATLGVFVASLLAISAPVNALSGGTEMFAALHDRFPRGGRRLWAPCLGAVVWAVTLFSHSATVSGEKRTANLNMELLSPALKTLKLEWTPDGMGDGKKTCGPEDVFDYIYAVLHCPTYRSRYNEFLKIDFPRVPFTSNPTLFWTLVALGREIRALHLLESPVLKTLRTSYPVSGSDMAEKIRFEEEEKGKVWINQAQYFGDVPKVAWEFFIGGYQPAQKWLKDRKGRTLSSDDILHYQRVIVALCETDRLMKEIDGVIEVAGGWPMQ